MLVHRSNRMEALLGALADVVRGPVGSPLTPETMVVPSRGMERWMSMGLSRRFGAWANADCPFPRAMVDRILDSVCTTADVDAFDREGLSWIVSALLPAMCELDELSAVAHYLVDDDRGLKRFQLARRIAHVFDQYAVYRPEMLIEWEREGGGWQGSLWREILARLGADHPAARARRFFDEWQRLDARPALLPERISVFGVSYLPPLYTRVLSTIADRVDVHVFLACPSKEYAADVHRRAERPDVADQDDSDALGLTSGNALFASLGRMHRDFQRTLEEAADYTEPSDDLFEDPGVGTMLATLQSDVLHMRRRGRRAGDAPPVSVPTTDDSIVIHRAHAPMREVEILRDQLRALLENDATLQPEDIVVSSPDLETYAPLVEAVFGVEPSDPAFIPYRVSDRTARSDNGVADALLSLLEVVPGRMKASEVLDLLQLEPIRSRFGIASEALPEVQRLVHEAGVRWGIDEQHRAGSGQPERAQNTWQFGLDRLLLGYAMPGDDRVLFGGCLPYDDVEGDVADLTGQLSEFTTVLFDCKDQLSAPRAPAQWAAAFGELLERLIRVDDATAWQLSAVRQASMDIAARAERAGFDDRVELEAMRQLLGERFERERTSHDFLSGGVTFCAMLPMRSIPFRVVCLLGMNDVGFPRPDRAASFDLVANDPRVGDRSNREEDRYLFLEALLSARQRLIVTYVGRGIQDDAEYPPSVVLTELEEALDASCTHGTAEPGQLSFSFDARRSAARGVGDHVLVEHPLQAFSPRYFGADDDPRLFSFSADDAEGASALAAERVVATRFQHTPLVSGDDVVEVDVDELARFFENPARALVQKQLGVYLDDEPQLVEDREPIELGGLDAYFVGSTLLARALGGDAFDAALPSLRAKGVLPLGTLGTLEFRSLYPDVTLIAAEAQPWLEGDPLGPIRLDVDLGRYRVNGVLRDVRATALARCQFARVRPKHEVGLWIRHLALCAVDLDGAPSQSVLVGRATNAKYGSMQSRTFDPIPRDTAHELLDELVGLFARGQHAPLCFFPAASMAYVEALAKNAGKPFAEQSAAEAAVRAFLPRRDRTGDANDAYVRRLFEGVDPFATDPVPFDEDGSIGLPSFGDLALSVVGPLLAHFKETRA